MEGNIIIEVGVVALLVFLALFKFRETSILRFFPYVLVLGITYIVGEMFELPLLKIVSLVLFIALSVMVSVVLRDEFKEVFNKESRKKRLKDSKQENLSEEILISVSKGIINLSNKQLGMMIVFNKGVDLNDYKKTGINLGATLLSRESLVTLFEENSMLNGGAAIIEDEYFSSANVRLPKTKEEGIIRNYGSRHQAAIGMVEAEDVLVVLVSGETGVIRLVYKNREGVLNIDSLTTIENNILGTSTVKYMELTELIRRILNIKVDTPKNKKKKKTESKPKKTKEERELEREQKKAERESKRAGRK